MRFAIFAFLLCSASGATLADLRRGFEHPPDDARIMVRWWWFGPSQTNAEIEREMRQMKTAGIGGFEVQPVYPLSLENNYSYLSPEFLDALRFAAEKAREFGLRMDVTLGSGWPFGGPQVPITQAAGKLRIDSALPAPEDGDEPIVSLNNLFFTSSRTRQMVKRAAAGAEGFVLDHYDRSAIDAYLNFVGEPLLKALATNPPHAIFSDSLEVYGSDWTPGFRDEFRRRRGYDLAPHLPSLAGNDPDSAAVRHDWGQTLTELVNENYLTPVREWAEKHHTRFRSQTYGTPPVNLSSNALVDLAEGEGWQWRQFSNTRWASSANHLYKRAITSSETWTWLHSPVFRATPLDLKAEADLHFLEGVNQIIGHGWPYSPPEAGEPGWHFYAAAALGPHNPWWIVMPDVAAYLQRVSFLLRQGEPVTDVAIYLPTHDAYARFTPGNVSVSKLMDELIGPTLIPQVLDAGYNFDFIDDAAIERGGIPYKILILPGVERIPLATLRAIERYRTKGGIAIATRHAPSLAPGLMDQDTARIVELSQELFPAIHDELSLGRELSRLLTPDLVTTPGIGYVHRSSPGAEIYFLVNTTNLPIQTRAAFRVFRHEAFWWDPFTGKSRRATSLQSLDLAPYESRVIVFSNHIPRPGLRTQPATTVDMSSDWKITIAGASEAWSALHSWTDDAKWQHFSGTVEYEKTIQVSASTRRTFLSFGDGTAVPVGSERRAGSGMRAWLESPVREAAVVYVNGKRAGSIWCPPYEVEVSGLLRSGANAIRIIVANLAVNSMAGHAEDDSKLNARYGERFQAQDMDRIQPEPSGLLGPIRLLMR
jgi:hypothetical protein